jgi:hypothetical protein
MRDIDAQFRALLESHTTAMIGAPLIILFLAYMSFLDWRSIRRKDPIKMWFWPEPIYPGDPLYLLAFMRRYCFLLGSASLLFAFVLFGILLAALAILHH